MWGYILLCNFPESSTTSRKKNTNNVGAFSLVVSGCISFEGQVHCLIWSLGSMEGERTLQITFLTTS